ncbi:nucleolar MIF4G domain-containing protein 1-like [Patiria miniata]|uniref:MI domain-containing protein n=1 Tax=Patiria miniata TaxID=46514 RepID=A0A914BN83_PATMI|nr:nucleolar MIF4G domain-containing protein 1-like [Patiria miniata]
MKSSLTVKPTGKSRGPRNLSRAKTAIHKMLLQSDDKKAQGSNTNAKNKQVMTRKEKRKQERKIKKAHVDAFHKKKLDAFESNTSANLSVGSSHNESRTPGKNREKNKRKKRNRALKLKEEKDAARREEELALANREDERSIKKIEKDMNFRKNRKTDKKIMPSIFKAEGLDYLLDLVDQDYHDYTETAPDKTYDDLVNAGSESDEYSDANSDTDSENDNRATLDFKKKPVDTDSHQNHKITVSKDCDEPAIDEDNSGESDYDEEEELEECFENIHSETDTNSPDHRTINSQKRKHVQAENNCRTQSQESVQKKSSGQKMDPYGNIIGETNLQNTGSYIPPQKRAKMIGYCEKKQEQLDRLRKQLKGLINRLSESNIQSIAGQIEELYQSHSRNDMNETLTQVVLDSCIGPILTGDRLVMEHTMLIAVLNLNIGMEVGAHFIETLARKLDDLYKQGGNYGHGKQCDNVILLFIHLYNFKVIHCTLMYDIIRKLVAGFTERDIEMLLLVLKNSGLMLRKDDPSALKEIILQIQTTAKTCSEEFQQQSRVKFMLETIYAVRNNNVRKIPNYDPAQLDHMRKILRALIKAKGHTDSDATLQISLEHLLSVEERGRWWIIGSSWAGNEPMAMQQDKSSEEPGIDDETSHMITELSRQQRMNTDLRKAIFRVVMTAEDYLDAYEKILHLSLKSGQEREVVHVTINCCLQEASFNPYYAHLGTKLCQHDRKNKMAFQFAFWDKFKILTEMSSSSQSNLAHLISHMLLSKAISISVLKVIEFADIDKTTVRFLRQTLRSLLLSPSQKSVLAVFSAVILLPKLRIFRDSLRLFLLHFVLPKTDGKQTVDVEIDLKLRGRVQQANQILAGEDLSAKF